MTDKQWKQLFGQKRIYRKVIVYNEEDFEEHVKNDPDFPYGGLYALIEIYSGPNGKPVLDEKFIEEHKASIIALDFEDFPEDVIFPGNTYHPTNPTITYPDAERLVKFIEWNQSMGRDFIIHCGAGVSRSQQVAEYIMRACKKAVYRYDRKRSTHTHHYFNTIVLSRLMEVKHKTIPEFVDKNEEFYYNKDIDRWLFKGEINEGSYE